MGFLGGLINLISGGSAGSAFSTAIGTSPLIKTPEMEGRNDIVENLVDNSALGQSINDSLGNSKSTSAKEIAARNAEMDYNRDAVRESQAWQEHMRDTQYLSTFKQLKELGINPYAMLSGLSGASTPGTSSASYSGYASSLVNADSAYRNARLGSTTSIVNSAISALSRLGIAAILKK